MQIIIRSPDPARLLTNGASLKSILSLKFTKIALKPIMQQFRAYGLTRYALEWCTLCVIINQNEISG